jgi:hypothetical protein
MGNKTDFTGSGLGCFRLAAGSGIFHWALRISHWSLPAMHNAKCPMKNAQ